MRIRLLVLIPALSLGGCYGLYGHDEIDRYFQRSGSITMSAGDAKQTNAVTHTITPWPPYVGDRRLAYDARRVGSAVTRYGTNRQPTDQLPDIGEATRQMGVRPQAPQTVNIEGLGAGAAAGVSVPVGAPAGGNR
jgi:hypothetical protein